MQTGIDRGPSSKQIKSLSLIKFLLLANAQNATGNIEFGGLLTGYNYNRVQSVSYFLQIPARPTKEHATENRMGIDRLQTMTNTQIVLTRIRPVIIYFFA